MRNTNWAMIGIAVCILAVLLYLMKQSGYMNKIDHGASEMSTSMEVENPEAEAMADGYPEIEFMEEEEWTEGYPEAFEEAEESESFSNGSPA